MATLAGMDLGYGSQVKIVRTNFLFVEFLATKNSTAQAYANLLHMYNRIQGEGSLLKADYIVPVDNNAVSAPSSGTSAVVADLAGTSNLATLVGPSASHLAQASGDGITTGINDTLARVNRNASILAVLNCGLISFDGAGFTTPAKVEVLSTTTTNTEALNAGLLADSAGGPVYALDITTVVTDAVAAGTLSAAGNIDMTDADLNANFVMKGNAAGTDETTLADVASPNANTASLVSITALVRTAQ
tara:strand:+ start:1897 stop:2634 length:738 start_codon:yes stop_codon:yes gene_type:complete